MLKKVSFYSIKCTALTQTRQKIYRPCKKSIMTKRAPEWIMAMILNPEEMLRKNPLAKELVIELV